MMRIIDRKEVFTLYDCIQVTAKRILIFFSSKTKSYRIYFEQGEQLKIIVVGIWTHNSAAIPKAIFVAVSTQVNMGSSRV